MTNWDDYRYLLAVGDHGSLAAAARSLGVSHPTVGRRITELETALDLRLIEKTPDGVHLTEAGRRIVEEARVLGKMARMIEINAAASLAQPGEARVRITASHGIAYAILTPLLSGLHHNHPDIAVDLLIGNRPANMRLGEADIALRMGDPVDDALVGRRLAAVEIGLFGHEIYLNRAGVPQHVDELAMHTIIESTGEIANLPQAGWLRRAAKGARVANSSDSILNHVAALMAGLGLVTLPAYLAADLAGVRRILRESYAPEIDVWMLFDKKNRDRPELRAVLDYFTVKIPERLHLLSG